MLKGTPVKEVEQNLSQSAEYLTSNMNIINIKFIITINTRQVSLQRQVHHLKNVVSYYDEYVANCTI